ncbi:MAG TPA: helix-turn-helix domain-containing protein [Candidatus Angelobacter sp.]|nr:helix-turn-helix domain-containing protein [Candidatus Angelobacter sp.]
MPKALSKPLTGPQYVALSEFRYQLRIYLRHMEEQARANGNHPQQYQLLLAIKGLPEPRVPTISTLAERMQMNHNSMVELVNRCEKRGLLSRTRSSSDRRWVTLAITAKGDAVLRQQASASRRELLTIGPVLVETLQSLISNQPGKTKLKPSKNKVA